MPQQREPSPLDAQKSRKQQPKAAQREAATPQPKRTTTEIARIVPSAPPQPKSRTEETESGLTCRAVAQQQVAFQREAQQLNSQHAPLSVATIDPAQRESANKQYRMNFSGNQELAGKGEGFLIPLQALDRRQRQPLLLRAATLALSDRRQEVANIPWPFCFSPGNDPIARGIRQFPFPLPPSGYQLPAGTYLYPIEKDVYQSWLAHQG